MSPVRKPHKGTTSNGATPSNSRKRKATDFHDDDTPAKKNMSASTQARRKSKGTPGAQIPVSSASGTPFVLEYPAKPPKLGKEDTDDVFRGRDDGGISELAMDYAVRPGSKWMGMKSYKNVKLSEQMFSTGSILYVNRYAPAPPPPPDDAPASELLQFDRTNLWVGRVLECRADSERDVFLRIFWLYWPEELPMGRQSYHGDKELVMSNAMDIIDAQSIASAAEVTYWDEKDEEGDNQLGERFWRQTFDVNKLGKLGKGGLSEIRRHCTCLKEYNPDHTMYKCVDEDCGIWNHEECLAQNVCARAYRKSLTRPLPDDEKRKVNGTSATEPEDNTISPTKRYFPTGKLGEFFGTATARARDLFTPDTVEENRQVAREKIEGEFPWKIPPANKATEWAGKFTATVSNLDVEDGQGKVVAKVVDLRGLGPKKASKLEGRSWTEDVACLRCGTVLE